MLIRIFIGMRILKSILVHDLLTIEHEVLFLKAVFQLSAFFSEFITDFFSEFAKRVSTGRDSW